MKSVVDKRYMKMCLALAQKAQSKTSPNPLVGCVLVKNDKVIGSGYHKKAGHNHAEVVALKSCRQNPRNATLYVNLEPCCFYGRTPPCTHAIIRAGISRVVCGIKDPNPKVSGKGIAQLQKAGINVKVGFLEKECQKLNKFFIYWITKGLPYVVLKAAMSSDYKIAEEAGVRTKITGHAADIYIHHLRGFFDAILVGANTVISDNPKLTVRYVKPKKNPLRIILDSTLRIPMSAKVLQDKNVFIATTKNAEKSKFKKLKKLGYGVTMLPLKNGLVDISSLLRYLAKKNITSILVEGGRKIFDSFLKEQCAQEFYIFQSKKRIGKQGLDAVSNMQLFKNILNKGKHQKVGEDDLIITKLVS